MGYASFGQVTEHGIKVLKLADTPLGRFCAQFDQVFCLSLPGSNDRRQYIRGYFREMGIEHYQFFDATDSADPSVQAYFQKGLVASYPPCFRCGKLSCDDDECNNVLIPSQVATYISYLRLWESIAASDIQSVLIVEDDVRFTDYAPGVIDRLASDRALQTTGLFGSKPVLLRFGWALCDDHYNPVETTVQRDVVKMANPCHAINRQFARRMLSEFRMIDHTVDTFQHERVGMQVDNFTIFPPLSYELSWSTGAVDSLIHPKEIRVSYLEHSSPKQTDKIATAQQAVQQHVSHIFHRLLLVIGHPRCGSGYMSQLLQSAGLAIGHEQVGEHGISSWMFAVDDQQVPFAGDEYAVSRQSFSFQYTIHHVRDPRSAVPSIMRDNQYSVQSFQFRRKHILRAFGIDLEDYASELERAVLSYIYWNKLVEKNHIDLVVRVEDEEDRVMAFLADKHLTGAAGTLEELPTKDVNSNKLYQGIHYDKPTVTEAQWSGVRTDIMDLLNEQCGKYGYPSITPVADDVEVKIDTDGMSQALNHYIQLSLQPLGWVESCKRELPVDANGQPLPWWTYPAIEFVNTIVKPDFRVFEYGGGHSTLWWSRRVARVTTVDHDRQWVDRIAPSLSTPHEMHCIEAGEPYRDSAGEISAAYFSTSPRDNFPYDAERITRRGLNDRDFISYADSINRYDQPFDCIVIDGMARRLCVWFAIEHLKDDGIIVFDNSNRSDYMEGYQHLIDAGFHQLRFWGGVAGATFPTCTSFFIRTLKALPDEAYTPTLFGLPEY